MENVEPLWTDETAWRLERRPTLDIGEADGALEYLLSDVRAALRRPDGSILVANGGSKEVREFDSRGRHVRTIGREGGGPGEFKIINHMYNGAGDSLFVYDAVLRRVSVFSSEGRFVRSTQIVPSQGSGIPFVVGVLSDGSLVVRVREDHRNGLFRSPDVYLRYTGTGTMLNTIAVQAGSEQFQQKVSNGSATMLSIMPPLFAREQVEAVSGSRIILGENDTYELGVYSPDGTLERVVRRLGVERPVTDQDIAVRRDAWLAANPTQRQVLERAFASMPRPKTMPFYEEVLVDPVGNLWVHEFPADPAGPAAWTVFDTGGRMLGTVQMPEGFRILQVGTDFVLGVAKSDLDVEHVSLYELKKP